MIGMNYLQDIQQAINYIEHHLCEPITSDDVASHVAYSVYHFHRIFESVLGISVKSYIRRRRLTNAALELYKTDKRVIDIATEYQFESQASFTRSFSQAMGITPGLYRKRKPYLDLLGRQNVQDAFRHYEEANLLKLEPEYIEMKEFRVVGCIERRIEVVGIPERDESIIPGLWERFLPKMRQLAGRVNPYISYGISLTEGDGLHFSYLAAVEMGETDEVPVEMEEYTIPGGTYAVFQHVGPASSIHKITQYIYGFWLPKTNLRLDSRPELELYDDRTFAVGRQDSQMRVCIPIHPMV